MEEYVTYEDVSVYSEDLQEQSSEIESAVPTATPAPESGSGFVAVNSDALTNETFNQGVSDILSGMDPDSVSDDVYRDYPQFLANGDIELPDYAVVYEVNGVSIYFPTEYAEDIILVDGMLVNLGASYTVGAQIDGYSVSNYLSSEITIPTYHSATWYQYQQNYGQPYRVVDRYVSSNNYISSSTRDNVSLEFTGGNAWQGFTFTNIALFLILFMLVLSFIFRKGR